MQANFDWVKAFFEVKAFEGIFLGTFLIRVYVESFQENTFMKAIMPSLMKERVLAETLEAGLPVAHILQLQDSKPSYRSPVIGGGA